MSAAGPIGTAAHATRELALLRGFPPGAAFARRGGGPISVERFLGDVAALAQLLPGQGHVVNLCRDRYRFAVGFAAAPCRQQVTLLPPNDTTAAYRQIAAGWSDLYWLTDTPADVVPDPAFRFPPILEPTTAAIPAFAPDQPTVALFTSGSTGEPHPLRIAAVEGPDAGDEPAGPGAVRAPDAGRHAAGAGRTRRARRRPGRQPANHKFRRGGHAGGDDRLGAPRPGRRRARFGQHRRPRRRGPGRAGSADRLRQPADAGHLCAQPPVDAQAGAATRMAVLHLQPASLPDYLDSTDILLRIGPNQLIASETSRWGERLSKGTTSALAAALARRQPRLAVTTGTAADTAALQWQVDVESFDVRPDGHCILAARWALLSGDGRSTRSSGRGVFAVAASGRTGDAAIAAAMSEAIGQLAERLAAATPQGPAR